MVLCQWLSVIYLCLVRMAVCEICAGRMCLPGGDYLPEKCEHCGSTEWLYGIEPQDGIRIRTGTAFADRKPDGTRDKRKNLGAKSLLRRERARRQFKDLKPKGIDEPAGP